MDLRTAIRLRRSVRRYVAQPVPQDLLDRLAAVAQEADHLVRPGVRVERVDGRERVAGVLARYAGVYGLVQGAPHLLVGLIPEDVPENRIDLGYVLEQVVLEATRLGLATCWMTGSYHPDRAARAIPLRPGEQVAAVVALGYPRVDALARLHDTVVRRVVAAHRRLSLTEIVFGGRWGVAWSPEEADPALVEVLECARLAPSARNRQPWRFVVEGGAIHLALTILAPIDAGIVMAHVALSARELGRVGRWRLRWADEALAHRLGFPLGVVAVGTFRGLRMSEPASGPR